jgi:hypothetical protein
VVIRSGHFDGGASRVPPWRTGTFLRRGAWGSRPAGAVSARRRRTQRDWQGSPSACAGGMPASAIKGSASERWLQATWVSPWRFIASWRCLWCVRPCATALVLVASGVAPILGALRPPRLPERHGPQCFRLTVAHPAHRVASGRSARPHAPAYTHAIDHLTRARATRARLGYFRQLVWRDRGYPTVTSRPGSSVGRTQGSGVTRCSTTAGG